MTELNIKTHWPLTHLPRATNQYNGLGPSNDFGMIELQAIYLNQNADMKKAA